MSTSKHSKEDSEVMAQLVVTIYKSGAMSVAGDIHDEKFALTMIDAARDSVRSHHLRKHGELLIPASSTGLGVN